LTFTKKLVHEPSASCYQGGCRRSECRELHRYKERARRAAIIKVRDEFQRRYPTGRYVSPFVPKHGTRHGYDYYGCRCYECVNAANAARKKYTGGKGKEHTLVHEHAAQ
jgi:hypothetical protein